MESSDRKTLNINFKFKKLRFMEKFPFFKCSHILLNFWFHLCSLNTVHPFLLYHQESLKRWIQCQEFYTNQICMINFHLFNVICHFLHINKSKNQNIIHDSFSILKTEPEKCFMSNLLIHWYNTCPFQNLWKNISLPKVCAQVYRFLNLWFLWNFSCLQYFLGI